MNRILEIRDRSGKLIKWLRVADLLPEFAHCAFFLATCADPEHVYASRKKPEADLEELGLL